MLVKRTTRKLYGKYGDEFSQDYYKNKAIVRERTNITSPKIINTIAGYATRMAKKAKEDTLPDKN